MAQQNQVYPYSYEVNDKKYLIRFNHMDEPIEIKYQNKQYYSIYSLNEIIGKIKEKTYKIKRYDIEKISSLTKRKKKLLKDFDIKKCLNQNINGHKLTFGKAYANFLPSIWNLFPDYEYKENNNNSNNNYNNINNNNEKEIDTIQINLYYKENITKLVLIKFNEKNIDKEQNQNQKLMEEIQKIPNEFVTSKNINNIEELNIPDDETFFKMVFILQDLVELNDLINFININYRKQIFIIIMNKNKDLHFKSKIEDILEKILKNEIKKSYFDLNNIKIIDEYNELSLTILKIYLYFNQVDDYDFIDFINKHDLLNKNIAGLEAKKKQILESEHYINIKICGNSSVGKSAFINAILGEKRVLTEQVTGTTNKNHLYICNNYHLRFFDDLGFDKGNEGNINEEIEKLSNKKHNIIIDEKMELSFGYNPDSRNEFNLLLYFFKYKNPYNIIENHLSFMKNQKAKEIPIFFVVNVYEIIDNKIFEDKKNYKEKNYVQDNNMYHILLEDFKHQLNIKKEEKEFNDIKIIPINCLEKKGFDDLFKEIYDKFKAYEIKTETFEEINGLRFENKQINLDDLKKENIFFKNIKFEDIISEQMKASVLLIKTLILRLTGQYSGELTKKQKFIFYLSRSWNYIRKFFGISGNTFYPLLKDLVKEIYAIFGEEIKDEVCNTFIKKSLEKNFHINDNGNISFKDFNDAIIKYRNLFHNTKIYMCQEKLEEDILKKSVFDIDQNNFSNIGKLLLKAEEKFFDINMDNIIKDLHKNEILDKSIDDTDDNEINEETNFLGKKEMKSIKIDNEKKEDKIKDEYELDAYEKDFNNIMEKIKNYIKKNFGEYTGGNIVDNNNDKILLKILFVELVCKDLTCELSKKSQNIWAFFYNLADEYNKAIKGLNDLSELFKEEKNI